MIEFEWTIGDRVFSEEFDETIIPSKVSLDDEENLPTLGECIFGFHSMALMARTVQEHNYTFKGEMIPLDLRPVFQFLSSTKNLLCEMHMSLSHRISSEIAEGDIRRIVRFISDCRTAVDDQKKRAELRETYADLFKLNLPIENTVRELLDYIDTDRTDLKQPYYLYERLSASVSSVAESRRLMIRRLSYAYKYRPSGERNEFACQLALLDSKYENYIDDMKTRVVRYCNQVGSAFLAVMSTGNADFDNAINAFRTGIEKGGNGNRAGGSGNGTGGPGGTNGNNNPFEYYCADKGCYGLLINGIEKYISLSGYKDAEDSLITPYLSQDDIDKWNIMKPCLEAYILSDPLLNGYQYAEINLQVVTNFPTHETLDDEIRQNGKNAEIWNFTCVERKMFSKTSPMPQPCYLFSRHRPCTKNCKISVRDFYHKTYSQLKVYYLKGEKIKEYTIK